jgi:hypothetical protein
MAPDDFNSEEPDESEADAPSELESELAKDEVASKPADTGDPASIVEAKIPQDIRDRYEVFSYRNAAVILSETRKAEFADILRTLCKLKLPQKEAHLPLVCIHSRDTQRIDRHIRSFGHQADRHCRLL